MSDSTTYIIVTAESLETLATAVEAKKQDGYIVSGAPYVVITGYAQDMTLASALSPIDFPDAVVDITGAYIGSRTKESGHPIYYVGDKVEPEEYDATLTLKSGATRPLFQDDFYVSPREISSTSDTTVKVIYKWEKGFEDEVTIAPKAVALTSIVIQDMPRKTTYVVGQTFTGYDGLEVTALYNNNSLKRLPASSYTVTGNVNTSTAGTNTVTVSYTEGSITKTVTFSIEVVVNIPVALEVLGDAKLQYVGKTIDASGLTFKATMLDGSVKDVTSSVTSDTTGALTDIGTKKVTFSYTENNVTASVAKYFNVTTMKPVALTMTGEFATQYINTAVNLTGLTFKVVYDNGDVADVTDDVTHTPSTWGSTVGIQTVVFTYTASGVTLTLTKGVEVEENVGPVPAGVVNFATKKYKTWGKLWWEGDQDKTIIAGHKYTVTIIDSDHEDHVFEHMVAHSVDGYADCAIGDARIYASNEYDDVPFTISSGLFWGDYLGYRLDTSLLDPYEEFDIEIYDETSGEYLKKRDEEGYFYYFAEDEYVEGFTESWDCLHHCIDTSELVLGNYYTLRVNGVNYEHLELREDDWAGTGYCIGDKDLDAVPVYICKSTSGTDEGDCVYEIHYKSSVFPFEDDSLVTVSIIPEPTPQGPNYVKYSSTTPFKFAPVAWGLDPVQQSTPRWDGTLQYSVGKEPSRDEDWAEVPVVPDGETFDWIVAETGDDNKYNVYIRGIGNTTVTGNDEDENPVVSFHTQAINDGDNPEVSVSGKLMALFDHENPESAVLPSDKCGVQRLFADDKNLTDASGLVLPSTLAEPFDEDDGNTGCLYGMFYNCIHLTTGPSELPATILADYCYYEMFGDCTALTTAPEILATTVAENCCYQMFYECTSLTTAPSVLPATTLANNCYREMFYGCTSLIAAPELPATTLADNCYREMFYDCTSLTAAPELPATILTYCCYDSMFYGCESIKLSQSQTGEYQTRYRIPSKGPVSSEGEDSFYEMFNGTVYESGDEWLDDDGNPVFTDGVWTAYILE